MTLANFKDNSNKGKFEHFGMLFDVKLLIMIFQMSRISYVQLLMPRSWNKVFKVSYGFVFFSLVIIREIIGKIRGPQLNLMNL
jgi:hypothetical protein